MSSSVLKMLRSIICKHNQMKAREKEECNPVFLSVTQFSAISCLIDLHPYTVGCLCWRHAHGDFPKDY